VSQLLQHHRSASRHAVLFLGLSLAAPQLYGQAPPSAATAAATARRLVSEAIASLRGADTLRAHRRLVDATVAWPTQSAYLWTRAQVAIAARDTSDAITALTQFAALGMSRPMSGDRVLAGVASHTRFASIAAHLADNAAPFTRSTVHATLTDSTLWPEGVTWDARSQRFFVGSIRHRTVFTHGADGTRPLWTGTHANIGAILGVFADPDGTHLWATTAGIPQMAGYTPADSSIAALLKVRISDGSIVARWDLPPEAAGHTLGDVTMGPTGDVFTSDSREPVLYRLRSGTGKLEAITDPLFRSLQGIAVHPDGTHLYVADYSHGLLRVDLRTRAVTRLTDAPSSTSLGVDGLTWYDGSLIGIQSGIAHARVMRFRLDTSGTRITAADVLDRNTAIADEPTIGTLVGNTFVYVANSQWEKHNDAGARIAGTTLAPAILLAVPLTPSR
jgi:sugar lactone lactonase YvrE